MPRPPKKTTGYTPKNASAKSRGASNKPAGERPAAAAGWQTGKGGKKRVPAASGNRPSTAKDAPYDRGAAWAAAKTSKQFKKGPGGHKGAPARPGARPGAPLAKGQPRSQQVQRQAWGHTAPPSRGRLEELLVGYGVALPATVLDKVWAYHQILRKNNHDLDLTRLIGFETIVQRHYADCLILHKMVKTWFGGWPSPMVDIGTGAGFPGLMIKIASPETKLVLSEPRNVRVDYLNNTIQELGLKDIEVFGHKFTSKSFQQPLKGAITRAFEPIQKTLLRLEKSLQVGGLAMFMKGPGVDEELSAPIPANYKLVRDERYRIPKTTLDRAFVVFERIA
jgi:16S rRNA (guanine527-N7)-methyltransferase